VAPLPHPIRQVRGLRSYSGRMSIRSPFESSIAKPGHGEVTLTLLPPSITPTLTTLTYKYPLKLISRTPRFTPQSSALSCISRSTHLHCLTYGGGLLPGDEINVFITLNPQTRLVMTTPQGTNKIYRTEPTIRNRLGVPAHKLSDRSRQIIDVRIGSEAALCYLPDPCVPYKDSRYEQIQTFIVDGSTSGCKRSSLCVLDWVTEGRTAGGENWNFHLWKGRNEVWSCDGTGKDKNKKLLLRDSIILDDESGKSHQNNQQTNLIQERTWPHGIVGSLILYGPIFESLASFLFQSFTSQPRIGGRNWSSTPSNQADPVQSNSNVIWTAARVRAGFVLVRFGAKDFAAAKLWLGGLLREEGSVAREFGDEALLCL
jgi:urease accessory protein